MPKSQEFVKSSRAMFWNGMLIWALRLLPCEDWAERGKNPSRILTESTWWQSREQSFELHSLIDRWEFRNVQNCVEDQLRIRLQTMKRLNNFAFAQHCTQNLHSSQRHSNLNPMSCKWENLFSFCSSRPPVVLMRLEMDCHSCFDGWRWRARERSSSEIMKTVGARRALAFDEKCDTRNSWKCR